MLIRFCLYGFLKNQRYFEPFLMLVFLDRGLSFFVIGLLIACRDLTVNLLEIPSGAIADSFGRRGAMMFSFIAYLISFLVLGMFSNIALLFLGMFMYGVGDTFRTGTHKAMIFEWLRLNDRSDEKTKVYGITRSWSQIGSAVSGLIAAAFVIFSGNYEYVFFFAMVPYVANLINFAGYPKELDGDHEKAKTIGESCRRLKQSLRKSLSSRRLRRLMAESMAWEGYFAAIKDYLQPLLQALALSLFAYWALGRQNLDAGFWSNEARQTAVLIGPIYCVLFLLSAWASRKANTVKEISGGTEPATRRLWLLNLALFAVLGIASFFVSAGWVVIAFVGLNALKNVWRPILITRFDECSESHEGATVLSIESQSQRTATFVMAPLIGLAIDNLLHRNGADAAGAAEVWPIGLIGAALALLMLVISRRPDATEKN